MVTDDKKYRWVKIADDLSEIHFSINQLAEIAVEGKRICLAKTSTGLKACAAKCPHAGGVMAEGKLDNKENIVCCVHNYHFSLTHGRDIFNEGFFLKIYPVEVNGDEVFVGF